MTCPRCGEFVEYFTYNVVTQRHTCHCRSCGDIVIDGLGTGLFGRVVVSEKGNHATIVRDIPGRPKEETWHDRPPLL